MYGIFLKGCEYKLKMQRKIALYYKADTDGNSFQIEFSVSIGVGIVDVWSNYFYGPFRALSMNNTHFFLISSSTSGKIISCNLH